MVSLFVSATPSAGAGTHPVTPDLPEERLKYSVNAVVQVMFSKTKSKLRRGLVDGAGVNLSDVNGAAKSVREWSMAVFAKDATQRWAFESIITAFLLTFYNLPEDDTVAALPGYNQKHRKSERALKKPRGGQKENQMICVLHGPGGSGKSTAINVVQACAESHCETIGHPHAHRTIVATAMPGVVATLPHGETAHKALVLMKTGSHFTLDELDERIDTQLVIIDEIFFAHAGDFEKTQKHLHSLMGGVFSGPCGGLNVIFAGSYSQLEPVGKTLIYLVDEFQEFHGMVNTFAELDGKWRFIDDPEWGERLL
jgi:hypothetical protein